MIPDLLSFHDGAKVDSPETWLKRRKELLELLASEEYGTIPEANPVSIRQIDKNNSHYGGHGIAERLEITIKANKGNYSFPFTLIYSDKQNVHPLFLFLSFDDEIYQRYLPVQEVISRGFAVAIIHYTQITSDDGDMNNGLSGLMNRRSDGTGWGKISLWAWAASRVLDALIIRDDIDAKNIAVIGHSRLGKTALWCGANDERIRFTCVNDSGCSGAAMDFGKNPESETVDKIFRRFPFWFCENYGKYSSAPEEKPFDQHMAIAACCPRYVAVTSASLDAWADPPSEKRGCELASAAWTQIGKSGLTGDTYGSIAYFLRDGTHFLALEDWRFFMDFIQSHLA